MEQAPLDQYNKAPLGAPLSDQEFEVTKAIEFYRGLIMDFLELRFSERQDWKQIRSQMLKLLGNNGLEDRLRRIVRNEDGRNGNRS